MSCGETYPAIEVAFATFQQLCGRLRDHSHGCWPAARHNRISPVLPIFIVLTFLPGADGGGTGIPG
jgi:hypothetical protein